MFSPIYVDRTERTNRISRSDACGALQIVGERGAVSSVFETTKMRRARCLMEGASRIQRAKFLAPLVFALSRLLRNVAKCFSFALENFLLSGRTCFEAHTHEAWFGAFLRSTHVTFSL
jgi:hypothetical protein